MEDTSQQLMIEMNRQLEELRLQQTKQAEEQSAWNQELKEELKDVLREIFGTELSNLRQQSARNQELKEKLKCDENESSVLGAHQVLDEMPESQNCIEREPCVELSNYNGQGVFEMSGGIKGGAEPPTYTDEVQTNDHDRSTDEVLEIDGDLSQDLVARHVLEEMSQSTKTIEVIGVLTKDDDDDDLFEMASWIEEDFEPPTYTKGYTRLMCFDPGGLLVINAFSCLIANEKSHIGHSVGKLIFYHGSYVDEVLVVLQAFDYELSAYLGWSAKRKSCSLDMLEETSNMLDVLVPLRKICRRPKADYKLQQMNFLNESASVTQSSATDPTTAVATLRMVDYIVVCFNVWVFDPGGHLLIHATFGVAENLLNTSAVHGHQEGRILIFIFDPGGTVKLNTKSLETKSFGILMAPLLHSFYAYTVQFMILGDKDHLKEGVLLQEFGVRFSYFVLNPVCSGLNITICTDMPLLLAN